MIGNPIGYPIGGVIANGVTVIFGTLSATEANDTVSSSATLAISASGAVTEAADTSAATGAVSISAAASIAEASDTLTATAGLAIAGQESSQEASDTVVGTGTLAISGTLASAEQDDTLSGTIGYTPLNGSLDATEDNDTLFADSTLRLPQTGAWAPSGKGKPKKKTRREQERLLDQALAKAFEPKRGPKRNLDPWLAEPVLVPEPLPVPEFNPQIADLSDYVASLQRQLAQRKFEISQMEADDELLLLSL